MASTEQQWKESVVSLDDHLLDDDILRDFVDLLGDESNDKCKLDDDDFRKIFESWDSNIINDVDHPVKPCQPDVVVISHSQHSNFKEKQSIFKSPSAEVAKKALQRQRAIQRWLPKRERRVFLKRKKGTGMKKASNAIPSRSRENGQFVKSTSTFVSITVAQNNADDFEDEFEIVE